MKNVRIRMDGHTYGWDRSSGLHHSIVIHFFQLYTTSRYEQFDRV